MGSNRFVTLKDDGSAAHSLLFTAGTTQYVNNFNISGNDGQLITINSTDTNVHYLVATGKRTGADYLNIQHSVATPANYWYAGANSTDNQGDATAGSGWVFTAKPTLTVVLPIQDKLNEICGTVGLPTQICLNLLAGTTQRSKQDCWNILVGTQAQQLRIQDCANILAGTETEQLRVQIALSRL